MSGLVMCLEFYAGSPLYRLAVHAVLALLLLGLIQWVFGFGPQATVAMPPVVVHAGGSYSSPFPVTSPSGTATPPTIDKPADNQRLVPRERPELNRIDGVGPSSGGIVPRAHSDLENIIVDPTLGGSSIQPQSHPELEGLHP